MKEALENFEKKIPGREMTPQLIMKCATNLKQKKYKKGQTMEQFLGNLRHLSMQNRGISVISNLQTCPNLNVLQIYDNRITKLEGLEHCPQLSQLSVYNNLLTKIEGLDNC